MGYSILKLKKRVEILNWKEFSIYTTEANENFKAHFNISRIRFGISVTLQEEKKKKPGFAARSFLILLNEYPSKGYSVMYMVNIQMNEKYFK